MSTELKDEPRSVTGLFGALGLVALLVLAIGFWWHWQGQARTARVSVSVAQVRPGLSPFVTPAPPSNDELVAMAVRDQLTKGAVMPNSGSKLIMCRMESGYASVTYVPTKAAGSTYVVRQAGGQWKVLWAGPSVTVAVAQANGLPVDYTKGCTAATPLYTF